MTFFSLFFFFNPFPISHDQCFRNFALRTIKVNKGKFTLEIGPLNGSCNEISRLTVNYVRVINHFSTSPITYCKPWLNE